MYSSTRTNLFLLFFVFALFLSACNTSTIVSDSNQNSTPTVLPETETDIPFITKEPENFQAEIVFSVFSDGEKFERKTFTAKRGGARLTKFSPGEKSETAKLETADGKVFLINFAMKIYVESLPNQAVVPIDSDSLQSYLTVERLNEKTGATFEKQNTENGLTKYLVRLDGESASEILLVYDEEKKIIVRQDFFLRNSEPKTLLHSFELKNLQLQTDENLFRVPSDFTKISPKEFAEKIWQERLKNE